MLNKNGLWMGLVLALAMVFSAAQADGIRELVTSKLDGKGSVDRVDETASSIVIDDKLYVLSDNVTVFDAIHRRNVAVGDIKPGNMVGFRSKPLPKPTAPYDQVIVKLWIMPTHN